MSDIIAPTHQSRRLAMRIALAGDWPGRTLRGELVVDDDFVRDFVGLTGNAIPWSARHALLRRLNHDLVVVPLSHGWGSPIQPDRGEAAYLLRQWREESDLFVFALIDGPFSAAVRTFGWEGSLVKLSRGEPDAQQFMAEAAVELAGLIQWVAANGADGVLIGDDIAYRQYTYVNPIHLRRSYFPYLTFLVEAAQGQGLPVVFHSDGNLWAILDDLMATGANGFHGLEPGAGMSLAAVRQRVGAHFCLWGNVDLGWLTQPRPPEEIAQAVQHLLAPLAGTPTILGTCGGLIPGLPGGNVEALFRAG